METEARVVVGVGLKFVELGIFLVFDFVFRAKPEGLDGVDALAVEIDGERDEGAVTFDDFLDLPVGGVVGAVVFQFDDDFGTAALAVGFFDFVATGAVAGPDVALLGTAPRVGVDLDGFRDHERGVETDAKLADEVGVFGSALAHGFQELLGAGVGDGA